ncbi:hypothetical protein KBC04_02440 [Candidatus Babeliales bacterium]|nr:hypothetical protein [Candidatus Babeliales bacterium]MBP9843731.1 hypothetical protein [Candidatus Babeliales bacterium]
MLLLNVDEVETFFTNIGSEIGNLPQAAGAAIIQEWMMRVIGEHCVQVRNKLNTTVKRGSKDYLNCNLEGLEQAIIQIFDDALTKEDKGCVERFRLSRNKLVHAELIAFMELMNVQPIGRQLIAGERVLLKPYVMKEALFSPQLGDSFTAFNTLAMDHVMPIFKRIIKKCIGNHKECREINRKSNNPKPSSLFLMKSQ